jgi:hypothetical protein
LDRDACATPRHFTDRDVVDHQENGRGPGTIPVMAECVIPQTAKTALAVHRVQWFTIAWMAIEVTVAIYAAVRVHSVALAAFGGDAQLS